MAGYYSLTFSFISVIQVFNKSLSAIYRISDPKIEGIVTNQMLFRSTPDGMIEDWIAKYDGLTFNPFIPWFIKWTFPSLNHFSK